MLVSRSLVATTLVAVALSPACSTTVRSYKIPEGGAPQHGGVPYSLPAPHLQVRQAIEMARTECVYAVVELGGLHRALIPLKEGDMEGAREALSKLLQLPYPELVEFSLSSAPLTVLIEETNTDVKENTGSKDKHTDTGTRKYSLLPAAAVQDSPSSLLYTTSDPSKALDVVMLPDPSERWELVVTPGTFSSVNTTINLTDGWQLASVGADSTNQVLGTVSDLAQAVVSATSQVDVAKIASDQAIQLQKLQNQAAQQADDDGSSLLDFESLLGPDEVAEYFYDHGLEVPDSPKPATPVQAGVRFLGYLRRVNLEVVRPGLYKVSDLGSPAVLPTVEAQYWQRVGI